MWLDCRHHVLKLSDYTSSTAKHYHHIVAEGKQPTLWMAPETLRKERLDEKSEVWSFGVIAWEMVCDARVLLTSAFSPVLSA
jgi:serine/threonine protein kinase